MKKIQLETTELRALLFWAMAGYTDSNGGTYERKIPKIIAKYCRLIKMGKQQFPSFGIQSHAKLLGVTKDRLIEELSNNGIKSL